MNHDLELSKTRRKFLRMLAASPVFAGSHLLSNSLRNLLAAGEVTEGKFFGWFENFQQNDDVITSPDQALDVMDFEPAARKNIPPAHWGYLATGVDDHATVRADHDRHSPLQICSLP